jgi:hypothetical protein
MGSCLLLYQPQTKVFFDTRYDFYGANFTEAIRDTVTLKPHWEKLLSTWKIDTLLLGKPSPLIEMLRTRPDYRLRYEDNEMAIFQNASKTACLKGSDRRCPG